VCLACEDVVLGFGCVGVFSGICCEASIESIMAATVV